KGMRTAWKGRAGGGASASPIGRRRLLGARPAFSSRRACTPSGRPPSLRAVPSSFAPRGLRSASPSCRARTPSGRCSRLLGHGRPGCAQASAVRGTRRSSVRRALSAHHSPAYLALHRNLINSYTRSIRIDRILTIMCDRYASVPTHPPTCEVTMTRKAMAVVTIAALLLSASPAQAGAAVDRGETPTAVRTAGPPDVPVYPEVGRGTAVLDHDALLAGYPEPEWYKANIPFLEVPDRELQDVYYYRWSTYKRHIRYTDPANGYLITEFHHAPG